MTDAPTESVGWTCPRWCWPEYDWQLLGRNFGDDFPLRWGGVSSAERVLINRGLAEEYGRALEAQEGFEIGYSATHEKGWAAEVAKIATAPLDARVRAMAKVIRGLP